MQAILSQRQTDLILSIIQNITEVYYFDNDFGHYIHMRGDRLIHLTSQQFRLLESLVNIFEQSQGVTFCLEGKKLNHKP